MSVIHERPHTLAVLAALTDTPMTAQQIATVTRLAPDRVQLALKSLKRRSAVVVYPNAYSKWNRYARCAVVPTLKPANPKLPSVCRVCQTPTPDRERRTMCDPCRETARAVSIARRIAKHGRYKNYVPPVALPPAPKYITPIRARALGLPVRVRVEPTVIALDPTVMPRNVAA